MSHYGYTVQSVRGCKVVLGEIPIDDFVALSEVWARQYQIEGDEWIADAVLAHRLGAALVLGPMSACLQWRGSLHLGDQP
jgi:hypothetical protein